MSLLQPGVGLVRSVSPTPRASAGAGLDHLQFAKAIGDFYGMVQTEYGGSDDPRLVPLLAKLSELLQWHAESLPDYGGPPADFYEQFICEEAASKKPHMGPDPLLAAPRHHLSQKGRQESLKAGQEEARRPKARKPPAMNDSNHVGAVYITGSRNESKAASWQQHCSIRSF